MASLTNIWYRNWQSKLQRAAFTSLRDTKVLCAFNALIDRTVYYDSHGFSPLFKHFENDRHSILRKSNRDLKRIDSPQLLLAALIHAFRTGKAMHLPTNNTLILWLEKVFSSYETSIGGQAGIIANQVALLGGQSILYTSHLSPKLAHLFSPRVKFPIANKNLQLVSIHHAAKRGEHNRTNWIFEFKKGDVINFGGTVFVAPRSNRIILSSPQSGPAIFEPNLVQHLPTLGENLDACIMSGYNALQPVYEDGTTFEYYLS
ncbi:MAG: ADP-dependent glucokinase/phosphofructokinase, partial [Candidatus Micrarchaeota archaeon]